MASFAGVWSLPPSDLEELAWAAGVEVWELRDWLAAEVERRRAEREALAEQQAA